MAPVRRGPVNNEVGGMLEKRLDGRTISVFSAAAWNVAAVAAPPWRNVSTRTGGRRTSFVFCPMNPSGHAFAGARFSWRVHRR